MIYYSVGCMQIFRIRGSVVVAAMRSSIPCAAIGALLRWSINQGHLSFIEADHSILTQTQAWSGFSVLVGFLIIFRSSQAYSRFWDGCSAMYTMRADWSNACAGLISFTETSKAPKEQVAVFRQTLVRLISMMHNQALIDLEEMNNKWGTMSEVKADTYELLDPMGLDEESLQTLHQSDQKVLLLFQWVRLLCAHNIDNGVLALPAPLLARAYSDLCAGMVSFSECVKISDTPFPFSYAQNCELLLLLHWILVPFVVSQWVTQAFWAFMFVFMQVFVLWSLNYIAVEIENPFGTDENDLDGVQMQKEMNRQLLLLLDRKTFRVPRLVSNPLQQEAQAGDDMIATTSFKRVWKEQRRRSYSADPQDERIGRERSEPCSEHSGSREQRASRCLRQEAQSPRDTPGELGPRVDSSAIMLEEGMCSAAPGMDTGKRNGDACPWDHGSLRWDQRMQVQRSTDGCRRPHFLGGNDHVSAEASTSGSSHDSQAHWAAASPKPDDPPAQRGGFLHN